MTNTEKLEVLKKGLLGTASIELKWVLRLKDLKLAVQECEDYLDVIEADRMLLTDRMAALEKEIKDGKL